MNSRGSSFLGVICYSLLLLFPALISGTVISVRQDGTGDFITITDAVAAASANDTIDVGPGIYSEYLDMVMPLSFISSSGAASTIIDGLNADIHLQFWGGIGSEMVGFTLINGFQTWGGGSIRVQEGATVTIRDCHFQNNHSDYHAGAIFARDAGTRLEVYDCVFIGNSAAHNGGAASAILGSQMSFTNCTFLQNSTDLLGGALIAHEASMDVRDCLFHENTSADVGGAIYFYRSNGIIQGNTFHANTSPGSHSGTVLIQQGGVSNVVQNIISGDQAGYGLYYYEGSGSHSCNIFWSNAKGSIYGDVLGPTEAVTDPLFCESAAGDFTIAYNSPATPYYSLCGQLIGAFPAACGVSPIIVSPGSLDFGIVPIGSNIDEMFSITNTGSDTLNGSVTEDCDHYSIQSGGGAYSLEPGASHYVTVRFEPTSYGPKNCTIDTGEESCADLSCTGEGVYRCHFEIANDEVEWARCLWIEFNSGGHLSNSVVTENPPGCPNPGLCNTIGTGVEIYYYCRCFDYGESLAFNVDSDRPCDQLWIVDINWVHTAVKLEMVTAAWYGKHMKIEWDTATEIDNAGFNIYRSLAEDGGRVKCNEDLISSQGKELKGATYTFWDTDVSPGVTYYYWLESIDLDGSATIHGPYSGYARGATRMPGKYALLQNFPNPFNPKTEIRYDISVDCHVLFEIFDVRGQWVVTLVDEQQRVGSKVVHWDAKDNNGVKVASGVYFYRLVAGDFVQTKKMVLLK